MATVIYRAPEDDSTVVTIFGVTLYDGVPTEVENEAAIKAFKANRFFDVADIEAVAVEEPKRRGRPPKAVDETTAEETEGGE